MRVLWFTNTTSQYEKGKHQYHGGGWIESLEEIVRSQADIELAISFLHSKDNQKVTRDKVVYFPIKKVKVNPIQTIVNNWRGKIDNPEYQKAFLKIIDDYKPDVIHVFGTEGPFGLIQELTDIPVIIHLQGLINPIVNAYFPVMYSKWNFIFNPFFLKRNIIGSSPIFNKKRFIAQAKRESKILKKIKYVCGRTEWDNQIVKLFNPNITYFHIDEILRPIFYQQSFEERKNDSNKLIILSTISPTVYKGIDVILRVAKQLSELSDIKFEWRIIGLEDSSDLFKLFERNEKVIHHLVNIRLIGKMDPDQIVDEMQKADVFVHPSYIDNSPNSVCEAQLLGLPVIACNVGGVSSLIKHEVTGILVPSNGVFEIVRFLKFFYLNPTYKSHIGQNAMKIAQKRHDKEKILSQLIAVYNELN